MAELDTELNQPPEAEKRINELSGKLKSEAEAKEAERAGREVAEAQASEANRKVEFLNAFSDIVAENPAAKEYKDEIEQKVLGGYTTEDAVNAVLAKQGKLPQQTTPEDVSPAGGSAATVLSSNAVKSVSEMTQEERRAAIIEAEARGDIATN